MGENAKRLFFVYNPHSGRGNIRSKLFDIIQVFSEAGYEITIYPTREAKDATRKIEHLSDQYDLVVCSGGDGTLDEVVEWLMEQGHIPSFCTACYREGRTGDRFMSLCKTGQIQNCCHPNALMTLKEYLMDYASSNTRKVGDALIGKELENIPNEKVRALVKKNLEAIAQGQRDFRL